MILSTFGVLVFLLRESLAATARAGPQLAKLSSEHADVVSPLDVFEIQAPLRKSYGGASCQQIILQHNFAASYGSPYVGTYSPPKNCNFTNVVFNMSITSTGINYDRLGLIFFGDIEVWRTTTAMPVRTGIYWNFQKDMTIFDALLRSDQKVIMELDNLYDTVFTGTYIVTITALYYNDGQALTPADQILGISSQSSAQNMSSVFSVPDGNATVYHTFPRNVERAVVSVLASGNGAEEFWYTNVPTEYKSTFNNSAISPYSPFREVQVWIDNILVGVSWPFPTIFTGGISPGLWVPIVGTHTYDLPSFEVDISPWLGKLCDGNGHKFELKVMGYDSKTVLGTIGLNWWISGSIFLWLDTTGNQTTATAVDSSSHAPTFRLSPTIASINGTNTSLLMDLRADRVLRHTSIVTTSKGSRSLTFSQQLAYTNIQNITAKGYNNTLYQITSGSSSFSSNTKETSNTTLIQNSYQYPISFYQAYVPAIDPTTINSSLYAELDRSLLSNTIPILPYLTLPSFHSAQNTASRQNGSCIYYWNDTYYESAGAIDPAKGTDGSTEQWFSSQGPLQDGTVAEFGRHAKSLDGYEPVLVVDEVFTHTIAVPSTETVRPENLR